MQNLANVHPIREDARNIENALCHGSKDTKVRINVKLREEIQLAH